MSAQEKKVEWIPILVTCIVFLFCTSMILWTVSERRKEDTEYFKGRMANLESRMNNADRRADQQDEQIRQLNVNLKDISVLAVQINQNVLDNTRKIDSIHDRLNPPKAAAKPKAKPKKKEDFVQDVPYQPPPAIPPARKTPYAVGGRPNNQ